MKKLLKVIAVILILSIVFLAGTFAKASNGWVNEVITNVNQRVGKAGFDKRDEIVNRINNGMGEVMKDALDPEITEAEENVEQGLEEYYDEKLKQLEETDAYKDVESQISETEQVIIDRYKKDIDKAFSTLE